VGLTQQVKWPTPRGQDSYERRNWKTIKKINEEGGDLTLPSKVKYQDRMWRTPDAGSKGNVATPSKCLLDGTARKNQQIRLADQVANPKMWRTPNSSDGEGGVMEMREGCAGHYKLRDQVQEKNRSFWPTPRSHEVGNYQYGQGNKNKILTLTGAVKQWPTPRGNKVEGYSSQRFRPTLAQKATGQEKPLGGQLNPTWVEWLMGFPIGWTDLEGNREPEPRTWEYDPADNGEIPRVATGIKNRAKRLECTGAAVVPQCTHVIGEMIIGFEQKTA